MKRVILVLVVSAMVLCFSVACDKVSDATSNITGNVAGKVMNSDGSPRGYMKVSLIDASGAEVQSQTNDDTGSYFFSKVPGGEYSFKVYPMGGTVEAPIEDSKFKLGIGKTKQVDIKLLPEPNQ